MERIVKEPQAKPSRLYKFFDLLATGGANAITRPSPESEELQAIEEEGFAIDAIQSYVNRLEINNQQRDAAMLRGAFNDLLGRIDALQQVTVPPSVIHESVNSEQTELEEGQARWDAHVEELGPEGVVAEADRLMGDARRNWLGITADPSPRPEDQ